MRWALSQTAWHQLGLGDARAALARYEEAKTVISDLGGHEQIRLSGMANSVAGIAAAKAGLGDRAGSCAAYAEARRLYDRLAGYGPLMQISNVLPEVEKGLARCRGWQR